MAQTRASTRSGDLVSPVKVCAPKADIWSSSLVRVGPAVFMASGGEKARRVEQAIADEVFSGLLDEAGLCGAVRLVQGIAGQVEDGVHGGGPPAFGRASDAQKGGGTQ